jgi:hypothetical protein
MLHLLCLVFLLLRAWKHLVTLFLHLVTLLTLSLPMVTLLLHLVSLQPPQELQLALGDRWLSTARHMQLYQLISHLTCCHHI